MFDRRLWGAAAPGRVALLLTITLSALGGIAIVFQAHFLSQIVAGVFLDGQTRAGVLPLLLLLLAAIVARAVLVGGSTVAAGHVAVRVKTGLRGRLLRHLMALGPVHTAGERTGELTNTLVDGIESLETYFSQYLPQLVIATLIPLTILAVVFPTDLLSAVVLLLTAPLIPLFMYLIGQVAERLTQRQWQSLSLMSAHFLDVLQGLTTLKRLNQSRAQAENVARISDRFRETTLSVLRVTFLSALALELLSTLSVAIIAVQIGLRLLEGNLAFVDAFFILILAPEFYLPLRTLGARFHAGMEGVAAANRIFAILETPLPDGAPAHRREDRAATASVTLPAVIRFEDVHFAYEAGERPALNGVTLDLRPGQKVALVGASGAGKSTVTGLLLRFISPAGGTITANGTSLHDIAPAGWRAQIAWVPQAPTLFHDTIAANIRLARPGAGDDAVIAAARQARLHDFIQSLPDGYHTPIGERGARLSGGQAQRLALARAFLKDAPLLILDEPTSNLDPETEADLHAATDALIRGRTVLVIAHRLSTVYQADQIYVLDHGRVIQSGPHAELVSHPGPYQQLIHAQIGRDDWSAEAT